MEKVTGNGLDEYRLAGRG